MTEFADALRVFFGKTERLTVAAFANVVSATQDSIVNGSAVTGAAGQPVDTGHLKDSWTPNFESPFVATITTNVEYAPIIEYNVRGATLRSAVGGWHSVAMTVAGFQRLVDVEVTKLAGG